MPWEEGWKERTRGWKGRENTKNNKITKMAELYTKEPREKGIPTPVRGQSRG